MSLKKTFIFPDSKTGEYHHKCAALSTIAALFFRSAAKWQTLALTLLHIYIYTNMTPTEFLAIATRNVIPFLGVFFLIHLIMIFIVPASWLVGSIISLSGLISLAIAGLICFRRLRNIHRALKEFLS